MSDNTKKEYNAYFDSIHPSDEFLERLTATLAEEQVRQQRARIRKTKQLTALAACAALAVGLTAALTLGLSGRNGDIHSDKSSSDFSQPVGNHAADITTVQIQTLPISSLDGKNITPQELADKIEDSLDYIAVSDSNMFVDSEHLGGEEILDLSILLSGAEPTDEKPDGESVYYMAVFTDGSVTKLTVTSGKYFRIDGGDGYYKIN